MSYAVKLSEAMDDWRLVLTAANRSPETIRNYSTTLRILDSWLVDNGRSTMVDQIRPTVIRTFLSWTLEHRSPATAVTRWAGLLAFFKFATAESFCDPNPMVDVKRPEQPETVVPIVTLEEMRTLLEAVNGRDFYSLRDRAIFLLLIGTGMRRSEAANLTMDDVDARFQSVTVMGKGKRQRMIHLDDATMLALRRYLRARASHRLAHLPSLFIGKHGAIRGTGINQLLVKRCAQAGIDHINPHAFRHAFAHRWLDKGGTEGGLMSEGGWRSRQMLDRYGRAARAERGRSEHARLNLTEGIA